MSDGAIIAIIGFATVLAAGIPTTAAALLSRQARDHAASAATTAAEAKDTIGAKNGNGDAMTMLARSLAQTAELLHAQERTEEFERRLTELSSYTHSGVHRLNGQVGMMWLEWAKQHGYDPDTLPDPQPSPEEKQ